MTHGDRDTPRGSLPLDHRPALITLRALVTARWVLLGLLAGSGLVIALSPEVGRPLLGWFPSRPDPTAFFATLLVWLLVNVITARAWLRAGRATTGIAGIHLLVDATVLTVLLGISGGPANPFTTIYFVPITLATQVSPRWTWALAGYCLACFAILFALEPPPGSPPGHHEHFAGHMRGMWVAFGVTGVLVTYFVHRIALSLARQRDELAHLREQAVQDRHLTALGTLAAGAAHELGTPLGTIQVLAGELPHMSPHEREEAVASIRHELSRCKHIVHRMASPELAVMRYGSEGDVRWSLAALAEVARAVARDGGVELRVTIDDDPELRQPREPLEQIMRELVVNAVDACRRTTPIGQIVLVLSTRGDDAVIELHDHGAGMDPEVAAHAFEPFFSTKDQGMGLGLYLARAQLRQLGGRLELDSKPGRGTSLRLVFPMHPLSIQGSTTPRRS